VLFHILIVAVQQEMYVLSCMSQFCTIITANGTSANNSVSHINGFILQFDGIVMQYAFTALLCHQSFSVFFFNVSIIVSSSPANLT